MAANTILTWKIPRRGVEVGLVSPQKLTAAPGETLAAEFDFSAVLPETALVATLDATDDEDTGYIDSTTPPPGTGSVVDFELVIPADAASGVSTLLSITITDSLGNTVVGKGCLQVSAGSCL